MYYIEVVPTDIETFASHIKTYQYSVKENIRAISKQINLQSRRIVNNFISQITITARMECLASTSSTTWALWKFWCYSAEKTSLRCQFGCAQWSLGLLWYLHSSTASSKECGKVSLKHSRLKSTRSARKSFRSCTIRRKCRRFTTF